MGHILPQFSPSAESESVAETASGSRLPVPAAEFVGDAPAGNQLCGCALAGLTALAGLVTSQTARQTTAPPNTKPPVRVSPSTR